MRVVALVAAGAAIMAVMAVFVFGIQERADTQTTCLKVTPKQDLDAIVNADPADRATRFCLAAGNYTVSETLILKDGDSITGPVGNKVAFGPATYGNPTAVLTAGAGVTNLIRPVGTGITVEWLELTGAEAQFDSTGIVEGTGFAIGAGKADGTLRVRWVETRQNDTGGASSYGGRWLHNHSHHNGLGGAGKHWNASGVICIRECEVGYSYHHDEGGEGIYVTFQHSTGSDDPAMNYTPNGSNWVHHNVAVNNGIWGIRNEITPRDGVDGQIFTPKPPGPPVTFLVENNRVAGNYAGGGSMRDVQNAEWRYNTFGAQTIGGIAFPKNNCGGCANPNPHVAWTASDSGRPHTDLYNIDAHHNTMGGERGNGCDLPDNVVACSNNQ